MAKPPSKVTWAEAFRDMVIAAMNHGQMIPLALFLVLMVSVIRASNSDLQLAATGLFHSLLQFEGVSYGLWIVSIVIWRREVRQLRTSYERELDRMAKEKNKLQDLLARRKFKSSNT